MAEDPASWGGMAVTTMFYPFVLKDLKRFRSPTGYISLGSAARMCSGRLEDGLTVHTFHLDFQPMQKIAFLHPLWGAPAHVDKTDFQLIHIKRLQL
jgi:hypothetical protein